MLRIVTILLERITEGIEFSRNGSCKVTEGKERLRMTGITFRKINSVLRPTRITATTNSQRRNLTPLYIDNSTK